MADMLIPRTLICATLHRNWSILAIVTIFMFSVPLNVIHHIPKLLEPWKVELDCSEKTEKISGMKQAKMPVSNYSEKDDWTK